MKAEMVGKLDGFDEDVICYRDENGAHANIPHRIVRHSPDGFEWGYGGSGPAEFALNILAAFIGQEEAEPLYQDFKRNFIATLPYEGGTLNKIDIKNWIGLQKKKRNEVEV